MTGNDNVGWAASIAEAYPEFGALARLMEEAGRESDRGVVLIMAGFLEQQLGDFLESRFLDAQSSKSLINGAFAPLSSFSARISACHALGLITEREFHDLNVIRKVRNDFAHRVDVSFETPPVKDLCKAFNLEVHEFSNEDDAPVRSDTRTKFTAPAMSLIMTFWFRTREVEQHRLSLIEWEDAGAKPEAY